MLLMDMHSSFSQSSMKPFGPGSSVEFTIRNFGIAVKGSLSGLEGTVDFDPQFPGSARFDVTVSSASVQTGIRSRDEHLKKKDYLDAVTYPRIRFRSDGVRTGTRPGHFVVRGQLTIKSTTQIVSIPFMAERSGTGYLLTGNFQINRRDFGVGDASISLSENLTISLRVITR
jgi:polyisoprenoid-binding protein YceI